MSGRSRVKAYILGVFSIAFFTIIALTILLASEDISLIILKAVVALGLILTGIALGSSIIISSRYE